MSQLKPRLSFRIAVLLIALVALVGNDAPRASFHTQEMDRVLEIERYPNEPLELVNLRIGSTSVKDRIRQKFKDQGSKWAIDRVTFKEQDDWYKRLTITVRNKSDKPIYGLQANLFFKPLGYPMLFSLALERSRELRPDPLEPGAEIDLSVSQDVLNRTLANIKERGVDLTNAELSFSLDSVVFSDEVQWYRGKLLQPDPTTPGKWVPFQSTP